MPWKFKNFDCEEDDHAQSHNNGNIKIRVKPGDSDVFQIHEPGTPGGWKDLTEVTTGTPDLDLKNDDFVYLTGASRWVYINGRWYKIG